MIENNVILNADSYGIRNVNSGAAYNKISDNFVYNCGQAAGVDGIRNTNGDNNMIVDNMVIQSGRYGIYNTSAYVIVTGNQVYFSDQHGIAVDRAGRGAVTGNAVQQSGPGRV